MNNTTTYGVLPSAKAFKTAFAAECPNGWFAFGNYTRTGVLGASELWRELEKATGETKCTQESLDWAACVLCSLGFEWA